MSVMIGDVLYFINDLVLFTSASDLDWRFLGGIHVYVIVEFSSEKLMRYRELRI
jgi:hypothetical protein